MASQKIVRARLDEPLREIDGYAETWRVVEVVGQVPNPDGHQWWPWVYVLLERDEEETAEKQKKHHEYLAAVEAAFR